MPCAVTIQEKGPLSVCTGRGPVAYRALSLRSSSARLPNANEPDKLALSETNRAETIGETRGSEHPYQCGVVDAPTYNRVREVVKKHAPFGPQKNVDQWIGPSGEWLGDSLFAGNGSRPGDAQVFV